MEMIANRASHRMGWSDAEEKLLWETAEEAQDKGLPLKAVFEHIADRTGRKPNSIRNYYYQQVRERDADRPHAARFTPFTQNEVDDLMRQVLTAVGQGQSVRACLSRISGGDHSRMLRYQNKYRTVLKHRPEMIEAVREELRREGLPYPKAPMFDRADAAFCDPEDTAAARLMAEPCVSAMLEGLKELMRRAARAEDMQEKQRVIDRLQVQQDLRRLAWEKDFDEASTHLEGVLCLLRDFLALPRESQIPQLDTFRDAAFEALAQAEEFLTRCHS